MRDRHQSINKFKKGWRTCRKYEDKASVPVFLFFMLVLIVSVLFYVTPSASDKSYFIVLVVVVIASCIGVWVKKRNQYNRKDK
jgi:hypothetical protein